MLMTHSHRLDNYKSIFDHLCYNGWNDVFKNENCKLQSWFQGENEFFIFYVEFPLQISSYFRNSIVTNRVQDMMWMLTKASKRKKNCENRKISLLVIP